MNKPNIQLKRLSFFEGRDGYGMNVDIWIDDVKCMHVYDDGWNGSYLYTNFTNGKNPDKDKKIRQLIADLEVYIKTLPPEETDFENSNGKKIKIKLDLDVFINKIVLRIEEERSKKRWQTKLKKMMVDSILIGVPTETKCHSFKFKKPFIEFEKKRLQFHIDQIKRKNCTGDNIILNTNLETLGIKV